MDQLALSTMLADITAVRQRSELLQRYKGYGFNLIRLLGAKTDEVKICRLLYELLSPNGSHSQGSKFLRLFYSMVLDKKFSGAEINSSQVFREYTIQKQRRIDLFIHTTHYDIPIEVKIHAGDQEDQCKDYFQYAKAPDGEEPTMYYLTLDGHDPSGDSTGNTNPHVIPISFANSVIPWLDACAKAVLDTTRLRESILQIKQALEEVCGIMNDKEQKDIVAIVKKSYDDFQNAEKISEATRHLKDELLVRIVSDIETKVQQATNRTRLINKYDYTKRAPSFYTGKWPNPPGISYLYSETANHIQIWVRAEIDDQSLWVTYCHVKVDQDKRPEEYGSFLSAEEICKEIHIKKEDVYQDKGWWIVDENKFGRWEDEYPYGWPDFLNCNRAWFDLLDNQQRDIYTTAVANRVIKLLRRTKK